MLDDDIQSELLRDTVEPERALTIAVNMEMGHQNQQRISSNNTGSVNVVRQFNRFRGANARNQQRNRNIFNCEASVLCGNCAELCTITHHQVCSAMVKKSNHCGILNHFTTVCRKKRNTNRNTQQGNRINNIENLKNPVNPDNQNVNFINYNKQYDFHFDFSDDNYVALLKQNISNAIAPQNMNIITGNTECNLLLDSGTGCRIIKLSLAINIMFNFIQAKWSQKKNHSN